ncbi:MAG: DUF1016 N-terminal domain-containing protein [Bacteroidales bacterium]|nr:DUF1016 N-terminal domain-containing protein [Bacteroidales bacterium]
MSCIHNLSQLSSIIQNIHLELQTTAAHAVNKFLTIRNWLIGYYIVEYEQNGSDRAEYGTNFLAELAQQLNIKGLTAPELSRTRKFYQTYIHFLRTVSQELETSSGTPSQEFDIENQKKIIPW